MRHLKQEERNMGETNPRVFYRTDNQVRKIPEGPFRSRLGRRAVKEDWPYFVYHFAHEFCHILSGFKSLEGNPNELFHEALCE